jgi:hypothetical protein
MAAHEREGRFVQWGADLMPNEARNVPALSPRPRTTQRPGLGLHGRLREFWQRLTSDGPPLYGRRW